MKSCKRLLNTDNYNEALTTFAERSVYRYNISMGLFKDESKMTNRSYTTPFYHLHALAYPFVNISNCIYSALRILYGMVFTVPLIFLNPSSYTASITTLILPELKALGMHTLNTIYSFYSILSRSLTTILSLGYSFSHQTTDIRSYFTDNKFIDPIGRINLEKIAEDTYKKSGGGKDITQIIIELLEQNDKLDVHANDFADEALLLKSYLF